MAGADVCVVGGGGGGTEWTGTRYQLEEYMLFSADLRVRCQMLTEVINGMLPMQVAMLILLLPQLLLVSKGSPDGLLRLQS